MKYNSKTYYIQMLIWQKVNQSASEKSMAVTRNIPPRHSIQALRLLLTWWSVPYGVGRGLLLGQGVVLRAQRRLHLIRQRAGTCTNTPTKLCHTILPVH